jgi:hypothetical protein
LPQSIEAGYIGVKVLRSSAAVGGKPMPGGIRGKNRPARLGSRAERSADGFFKGGTMQGRIKTGAFASRRFVGIAPRVEQLAWL